jgi:tyrosyl-tRNA synthetase
MNLSEVLLERGYVYQHSASSLEEITDGAERTLYLGIDPSSDSLQAGQLLGFLVLRRFIEHGHRVILVIGGGTGMIGDPGGKSAERVLLDAETVEKNAQSISKQARRLFGSSNFELVNNADWLGTLSVIEFLRDVGKHFTVNAMLQREFIRERIENPDQSISYTEFSYALLQAYDFYHLNREHGVDLQVGGSDQWGNILSGVDYIRRASGNSAYALTWPLLINKSTGKKFGKSEQGTVWLDPQKTTPFQFYQFWLNTDDESVEEYLLKMTLLPAQEIAEIRTAQNENPATRIGQRRLAWETTALVHGEEEANRAQRISDVLFGEAELKNISDEDRREMIAAAPSYMLQSSRSILAVLVQSGLAVSKREARQFIHDGAITLNGRAITSEAEEVTADDVSEGIALIKRGKRNVRILTT